MEQVLKKAKQIQAKPIVKWAGGKTQMLGDIMPKIPQKYGKYIEPFIGGGALFFALSPDKAIIADSNPELINLYQQVADNVETVISYLKKYSYLIIGTPLLLLEYSLNPHFRRTQHIQSIDLTVRNAFH